MSERRPHWDDELIFAVMSAAGDGGHLFIDDIHAVIAAVEDWHKAKRDSRIRTHSEGCWRWHNECAEGLIEAQQRKIQQLANQLLNEVPGSYIQMKARALTAEAAIARVRELHAPIRVDLAGSERCGYCAILPWPCDTIRALDGDA